MTYKNLLLVVLGYTLASCSKDDTTLTTNNGTVIRLPFRA
jgi:hypothetical protein